jgi:hypothetical protein
LGPYRIDFVLTGPDGRRLAVECDDDPFLGADQWTENLRRQTTLERVGYAFGRAGLTPCQTVMPSQPTPGWLVSTRVTVMTDANYRAAWVPDDDPQRPSEDASRLAIAWIEEETAQQNATPLLVTPTRHQQQGAGPIADFGHRYQATTPQSDRTRNHRGPVLAYVPGYREMDLAVRYARGSSLAVVESVSCPLFGWAIEVGAVNLATGQVTEDTRTIQQREGLDRIHFYGNNGWAPRHDRAQVAGIVKDLIDQPGMSADVILGCMVARGHGGDAVVRLSKVIESL